MPQNMFQTISSFFISLTIFVGGIFGFTPPPQPEASVATSTPKIEQVIPAETTATKKAPSISTQKSQTEKSEPSKLFFTPSGAVIGDGGVVLYTPPQATTPPKTLTTPSGAVLDESGNVLYTPPQQPRPPQTYTLPLPKGSVIDESGNVLYVPPPEKKYVCRTENTAPRIPLIVKKLPGGDYGTFNKNGAIIQQFPTEPEAFTYAHTETNGEIDKSKNKSVCGWE